jgi:hypothetical protein
MDCPFRLPMRQSPTDEGHRPHTRVLLTSAGNHFDLVSLHRTEFKFVQTTFPLVNPFFSFFFAINPSLVGVTRRSQSLLPTLDTSAAVIISCHCTHRELSASWLHRVRQLINVEEVSCRELCSSGSSG